MGGATFAVSALAPDLIRILATEEYMEAIWIIAPVSASVYFIFLYMVFANVEMYYGENNGISVISIICDVRIFCSGMDYAGQLYGADTAAFCPDETGLPT